jgi:hypothetical protein
MPSGALDPSPMPAGQRDRKQQITIMIRLIQNAECVAFVLLNEARECER